MFITDIETIKGAVKLGMNETKTNTKQTERLFNELQNNKRKKEKHETHNSRSERSFLHYTLALSSGVHEIFSIISY